MPTILKISLDAEEYRQQLASVLAETKTALSDLPTLTVTADTAPAQAALSDLSGKSDLSDKEVKVDADAAPAVENVEDLSSALEELPEKKDIVINVKGGDLKKTITVPDQSLWSRTKAGLRDCWKEMTNVEGGAKKLVGSLLAGGGLIGIIAAGAASVVKIVCTV